MDIFIMVAVAKRDVCSNILFVICTIVESIFCFMLQPAMLTK